MIRFHIEEPQFELSGRSALKSWLGMIANRKGFTLGEINYIFAGDDYVRDINKQYLGHDYETDILTFPMHPQGSTQLSADIYISVTMVKANAGHFNVPFIDELHRVMVHGILHLCGYTDEEPAAQEIMRKEEDIALHLRMF